LGGCGRNLSLVPNLPSAAKQFAEILTMLTSGAEALVEQKGFIAALKALRHPKPSFSANCEAALILRPLRRGCKPRPFKARANAGSSLGMTNLKDLSARLKAVAHLPGSDYFRSL